MSANKKSARVPTQGDLDRRLLGLAKQSEHFRGVKADDLPAAEYSYDVTRWPILPDGRLQPQINWGGLTVDLAPVENLPKGTFPQSIGSIIRRQAEARLVGAIQ
jgi:hypothetical protein